MSINPDKSGILRILFSKRNIKTIKNSLKMLVFSIYGLLGIKLNKSL